MGRPKKIKKGVKNTSIAEEVQFASIPLSSPKEDALANKFAKIASAATEGSRRNRSSTIERTDKYQNIDSQFSVFQYSGSQVTVSEIVDLCQKAYYNFPIFRNTIELMVEFSTNNIYFRGGSAKSKDFFNALFNKSISIFQLQDKFFREYYRSGNVFIYRHDSKATSEDILKITQTFGVSAAKDQNIKLPIKYVILNPADISFEGSYSFDSGTYHKVLNSYEINLLKNRRTQEDELYFQSLPPEVRKSILNGDSEVLLPLNGDAFYPVFYKKQDYEPFSVPMGYGVLSDINWKEELKKMDMALSRVIQQVILLITTGNEPEKGGINQKNIESLRKIFENESIGRVLVADYTTKAEFVIPQIADILDPKKYEIVNQDIMIGLHNILVGNEKFANQSLKIQLFVEKLRQARRAFIDDFLLPEIKRIAFGLGFKNYPTPYFEEFDLKNEVEFARIYTRLAELGILTPSETIKAIESGVLPDEESSLESQKRYKEHKDEELYWPIATIGQQNDGINGGDGGRPNGTTRKQSTKKISPIGANNLSISNLINTCKESNNLFNEIRNKLMIKHKIKSLSSEQINVIEELVNIIMANEDKANWITSIDKYLAQPIELASDKKEAISSISKDLGIDFNEALLLFNSNK